MNFWHGLDFHYAFIQTKALTLRVSCLVKCINYSIYQKRVHHHARMQWYGGAIQRYFAKNDKSIPIGETKRFGLAGAYCSSIHESTGFTPNMLMLGRENRLPAGLIFGDPPNTLVSSFGEYIDQLKTDIQQSHILTRTHLETTIQDRKIVTM